MQTLWQDLRYGVRMLLKQKGVTAIAVLTLALGIGANTAIFSVVNGVLLKPLPYREPEQLMMVWESFPGSQENMVMPANFADWRTQNRVFTDMAAWVGKTLNLSGSGEPEKLEGLRVTANLFSLLGVQPSLGRTFLPEEDQPGANQVALISHGLWQRRFAGAAEAIGSRVLLDGTEFTIIGVMPPKFHFPARQQVIWIPLALSPEQINARVAAHYLSVIARRQPDVTESQAQTEMSALAARLEKQYPQTNVTIGARTVPLKEQMVGDLRQALLILFAAAGFVLLVACTNVANLLLFRAAVRQKEVAVRLALGAGRERLMRQLLTESLLLALLGGGLGLLLALWGVSALVSVAPERLALADKVTVDWSVLGFTLAASALTGVIFGLFPAFQATRLDLNEALKEGGRDAAQGRSGVRSLLVVVEVALALILMTGAGLMINSFLRLRQVDAGFKAERLLTMEIDPTLARYPNHSTLAAFYDQLLDRIAAMPGVESASVVTRLPLTATSGHYMFSTESQTGWKYAGALPSTISPGYFQTMGIPLLRGRAFTAQDNPQTESVAIINEAMAQRAWPSQDPLGKRIRMYPYNATAPTLAVVGVVKDVKQSELQIAARPQVYRSYTQVSSYPPRDLVIKTRTEPLGLAAAIRAAIQMVDKDQPISNIRTMEQILTASLAEQRFNMLLLASYAALALVLAAVGIYGVMSYLVTQHTREIGIRLALGAQARDVLRLVVGQGLTLTCVGIGIGLAGARGLLRLLKTLLFEVSTTDPLTFAGIAFLLFNVALLACWLPARRAAKVDPLVALRYE
jgi:putative ABC transport system permease protein